MTEKILRRLIVMSETKLTIVGTLMMSFGINLMTNTALLSSDPEDFYDLLNIFLAIPAIFSGAFLFAFLESSRQWSKKRDEVRDITRIAEEKGDFIKYQMRMPSTKRLAKWCCYYFLSFIPLCSLLVYKIIRHTLCGVI